MQQSWINSKGEDRNWAVASCSMNTTASISNRLRCLSPALFRPMHHLQPINIPLLWLFPDIKALPASQAQTYGVSKLSITISAFTEAQHSQFLRSIFSHSISHWVYCMWEHYTERASIHIYTSLAMFSFLKHSLLWSTLWGTPSNNLTWDSLKESMLL